jgi:transcriptional regulator with XRE-family HTH domain
MRRATHPSGPRLLRDFLTANNITQMAAAEALGVTPPTITYWLAGEAPRAVHRKSIAVWTRGAVPADAWESAKERARVAVVRPFTPATGTEG